MLGKNKINLANTYHFTIAVSAVSYVQNKIVELDFLFGRYTLSSPSFPVL